MTDLSQVKIPSLRSKVGAAEWQARIGQVLEVAGDVGLADIGFQVDLVARGIDLRQQRRKVLRAGFQQREAIAIDEVRHAQCLRGGPAAR